MPNDFVPDARSDELHALRHIAYVLSAYLGGTADHNALRLALQEYWRCYDTLSRGAFRRSNGGSAGTTGGDASHCAVAKQPPRITPHANIGTQPETATAVIRGDEDVKIRMLIALRELGLHGRTEMRLPAHAATSRSGTFPADIVVVQDKQPRVAIEAKASANTMGKRQRENYAQCGLPAVLVTARSVETAAQAIAGA